jgi:SAM-dependent methyltransferase
MKTDPPAPAIPPGSCIASVANIAPASSIASAWFEQMYAADPDPWGFATSAYEREKYAASLAALPPRRFARALEVGCSIGVFTGLLAARCDDLLAVDVSPTALAIAHQRCPGVRFAECRIPGEWPSGRFDLVVLSEVLYYLNDADSAAAALCLGATLRPGGCALLVHYLGPTDYPASGDAAAERFIAAAGLPVGFRSCGPRPPPDAPPDHRPADRPATLPEYRPRYRIDRLDRPDAARRGSPLPPPSAPPDR